MAAEKIVTESALAALASDAKRAIYDVLPGGSATGNPCTFDTDIAVPLKSLIANITASGGGGTPSTPIPIVGHSELNLVRCGVNLFDKTATDTNNGYHPNAWLNSANGIVPDTDANISEYIRVPNNTNLFIKGTTFGNLSVCFYDESKTFISGINYNYRTEFAFTTPDNTAFLRFSIIKANIDITQLELGSTATPYAPYNGDTFTVQFGQTVYGGVYDANRGKVKPNVYYPSYNGETITGRWLSSKDVYVEGNTPTTGAQVVCLDEYDTEIDVSELSVDTIVGVNNITSDGGGDVEVEYRESVEKYVTEHGGGASWTDVVGTLTAGNTNITLSNAAIKTTSTIQVFTDPEVPYSTLAVSSGSATLTFDAQANDVSVKVRVT